MKKLLSLALSFLMLLSCVPFVAVSAATPNLTVSVDATQVSVGDAVTVTLSTGDLTITTYAGGIHFDTDMFECTEIKDVKGKSNGYLYDVADDDYVKMTVIATTEDANTSGNVGFAYVGITDRVYAADTVIVATFVAKTDGTAAFEAYEDSFGADGMKYEAGEGDAVSVTVSGVTQAPPTPSVQPTVLPTATPDVRPTDTLISQGNLYAEADKTLVAEGGTVTVTLYTKDLTVASYAGGVHFDTDAFECISIKDAKNKSNGYLYDVADDDYVKITALSTPAEANGNGNVGFAYAGTRDRDYAADVIVKITFTAKTLGTFEFQVYEDSFGVNGTKYVAGEGDTVSVTVAESVPTPSPIITFLNDDGSVLSSEAYEYGAAVIPPATPEKPADNTYTYTFAGWDKDVTEATEDATYTATYTATYIDYTVTFLDDDGTVLLSTTYHYGDPVTLPGIPEKPADNTYTYAFEKWDTPVVDCGGDAVYTAVYTATYIDYVSIFQTYDGTEFYRHTRHYGESVVFPVEDPIRPDDDTYTYTFAGYEDTTEGTVTVYKATYTVEKKLLLGDVDGNGAVEANDLTALARHLGGVAVITGSSIQNGDVDGNGAVEANDLTALARHLGGIEQIPGSAA